MKIIISERQHKLLLEQSNEEEIKKKFIEKFPCLLNQMNNSKFEDVDGKLYQKIYNKSLKGNMKRDLDGNTEFLDGPHKGRKSKGSCKNNEYELDVIELSPNEKAFQDKLKNFPCLDDDIDYFYLRLASDGKLYGGINYDGTNYYTFYNLDDKTYYIKGGNLDGQSGNFSCSGDTINYEITKPGTTKKVSSKTTPMSFEDISASNPLTYGMRDKDEEGLIWQMQSKLKELVLYNAEPDGQFGPITHKSVIEFQKKHKDKDGKPLIPDGKAGPKTIESMGLHKY
jgi:hypothetical protein